MYRKVDILHSPKTAPFADEPKLVGEASMVDKALTELARSESYTHAELCQRIGPPSSDRLAAIDTLDERQLWRTAYRTLSQRDARRIRALARLQQQHDLTTSEKQDLTQLLGRLENAGMVRAKVAALLKERGHDVSALPPNP